MRNLLFLLCIGLNLSTFAQKQRGKASFYDVKFEGRTTANGETFTQNANTAAHKTLPFNAMVKVTNLANGKTAVVRINDRGPFIRGRIIDLTTQTAKELGFFEDGLADVEIELLTDYAPSASTENSASAKEEVNQKAVEASANIRTSLSPSASTPAVSSIKKETPKVLASKSQSTLDQAAPINQINSQTNEILEVFSLDIKLIEKTFYGVQIASFTDASYLMRFASDIKTAYKEQVIVMSKLQNEKKLFTLVLGQFDNRLGAERFIQKVKSSYPDAFIVEINQ